MTLRRGSQGAEVKRLQKLLGIAQDGIFGSYTERAVKELQLRNGLSADGVVGTKTWALLEGNKTGLKKSTRRIDMIVVHCTATPEGQDVTVEAIRKDHKSRGYADIGYHYVIYRDGSVHEGRDVNLSGAHTQGYNSHSIGVCYVGGLENIKGVPYAKLPAKDTRTEAQKTALLRLLKSLRVLYPKAKIYGHRDFAKKACPSFDAKNEYKDI